MDTACAMQTSPQKIFYIKETLSSLFPTAESNCLVRGFQMVMTPSLLRFHELALLKSTNLSGRSLSSDALLSVLHCFSFNFLYIL